MDHINHGNLRTSSWNSVMASWMNSLQEVTSATRLSLERESEFMVILINRIYESEKKKVPEFQNSEELIDKFTKEYLQENQVENHLTLENGHDRYIIYALLIYTSCIRCQLKDVLSKNCQYTKGTTQAALQKFFQEMIWLGEGNFTRENILNAIRMSLESANSQRRRSQSPIPSRNCLREFFDESELYSLKTHMNELEKKIQFLEIENENNISAQKVLESKIENLTHDLNSKSSEMSEAKASFDELYEEKKKLQVEFTTQESELHSLKTHMNELEEKIQFQEIEKKNNISAQKVLGSKIENLTHDLNLKSSEISEAKASFDELYEERTKLHVEFTTQESELHSLKAHMNELEEKIQFQEIEKKNNICTQKVLESKVENLTHELNLRSSEVSEAKVSFDKLYEEKTKLQVEFTTQEQFKQQVLMEKGELLDKCNLLDNVVSDLRSKLVTAELSMEKTQKELEEQRSVRCELNDSLRRTTEEVALLKPQIKTFDPQLKEAYDKLFHDFHILTDENDSLTTKYNSLLDVHNNVRAEYEAKLKKLKVYMKDMCIQAMQQTEDHCGKKEKGLEQAIKANQEHINQLSAQLWDTSEKLISTKKENEELKKSLNKTKLFLSRQSLSTFNQRAQSLENVSFSLPDIKKEMEEVHQSSRRQSSKTVPTGMGKVFPSEDEAEEMFNNECLADLKAGRCEVPTDPDRVSTLMYRNSLCPPHLKSSYSAETQFLPVDVAHEDDIKGRTGQSDASLDKHRRRSRSQGRTGQSDASLDKHRRRSRSQGRTGQSDASLDKHRRRSRSQGRTGQSDASLDKHRRRSRSQTSYKKPGPPMPSKHGSRPSSQMFDLKPDSTPKNALRELNDGAKKPGTPSKLFSHFFTSRSRDKNELPMTPNQRRQSFFSRHFGKRDQN